MLKELMAFVQWVILTPLKFIAIITTIILSGLVVILFD